jgi:mono/diheme cytochrome c family protein
LRFEEAAVYFWFGRINRSGQEPNINQAAHSSSAGEYTRRLHMKKIRSHVVLALALAVAGTMAFAEDGAALYKTKCASCHGAAGTPNPGMAKAMGIKPVSDPAVKALTLAQVEAVVKSGKGKMHPVAGLSDPQVKAVSAYFKTLK